MADRVHALMDAVQAPGGNPVADRTPAESELEKLPTSDHAVLPMSERRDPPIPAACARFLIHVM
jgi:hypothetical protein